MNVTLRYPPPENPKAFFLPFALCSRESGLLMTDRAYSSETPLSLIRVLACRSNLMGCIRIRR